ncbi:hypothetical protein CYLTODRAFT_426651, partial [Cylindrobasidium torrendii FP15055 ss-10]
MVSKRLVYFLGLGWGFGLISAMILVLLDVDNLGIFELDATPEVDGAELFGLVDTGRDGLRRDGGAVLSGWTLGDGACDADAAT